MVNHSHFNCCIEVGLPIQAGEPACVFHYEPGEIAPKIGEAELGATISRILVQLGDAPGVLTLSVEVILTKDEVAARASPPLDETPTFALMHARLAKSQARQYWPTWQRRLASHS